MAGLATNRTMGNIDPSSNPLGGNAPFASGPNAGLTPNQMANNGYQWDLKSQSYQRSPSYAGAQAGQFVNGYLSNVPSLNGLGGGSGSFGGGGLGVISSGTPTSGGGPGGGSGGPAQLQMPDQSTVTTNAFNAARDRAAGQARASLSALNGELGASGMMGGGAQVQGTSDILNNARQSVSDVNRQAATSEAQTAADFAKTNYEGGIAQRGQDITAATARRGQDAQFALAQQTREMQLLSLALQGLGRGSGASQLY